MVSATGRDHPGSAERSGERGKRSWSIRVCPMKEVCSTAHNVRRFDGGSARGYVGGGSTEQDSYEPRPAGREGAERLTAWRLSVFLLTAPPPFPFWGAKKTTPAGMCRRQPTRSGGSWPEAKWGWNPAGDALHPPVGQPGIGGASETPPPTGLSGGAADPGGTGGDGAPSLRGDRRRYHRGGGDAARCAMRGRGKRKEDGGGHPLFWG